MVVVETEAGAVACQKLEPLPLIFRLTAGVVPKKEAVLTGRRHAALPGLATVSDTTTCWLSLPSTISEIISEKRNKDFIGYNSV